MSVQIPKKCTSGSNNAKIVCSEKGRKITFLNPDRKPISKHIIDNCAELRAILEDARCKLCDFLVVDWRKEEHFVEIKGKNVEHALKQLASTIPQISLANPGNKIYCWIITSESPAAQSKFQVLKEKFEKKMKVRLKIKTDQCEYSLEDQTLR
jgi:hypothetical protein